MKLYRGQDSVRAAKDLPAIRAALKKALRGRATISDHPADVDEVGGDLFVRYRTNAATKALGLAERTICSIGWATCWSVYDGENTDKFTSRRTLRTLVLRVEWVLDKRVDVLRKVADQLFYGC